MSGRPDRRPKGFGAVTASGLKFAGGAHWPVLAHQWMLCHLITQQAALTWMPSRIILSFLAASLRAYRALPEPQGLRPSIGESGLTRGFEETGPAERSKVERPAI
jgi:hypothetical protein